MFMVGYLKLKRERPNMCITCSLITFGGQICAQGGRLPFRDPIVGGLPNHPRDLLPSSQLNGEKSMEKSSMGDVHEPDLTVALSTSVSISLASTHPCGHTCLQGSLGNGVPGWATAFQAH